MFKSIAFAVAMALAGPSLAQYAPENEAGLAAAQAGEWQAAWDIWKPLADAGDARAQSNIGVMYDRGQVVAEDDAEALRWFTLSAEGGFATGQFNLANMYRNGNGVVADLEAALGWYQRAARQGHPQAQMALVHAYSYGYGAEVDKARAYMWMTIAAESGFETAIEGLDTIGNFAGKAAAMRGRDMALKCIPMGLARCP